MIQRTAVWAFRGIIGMLNHFARRARNNDDSVRRDGFSRAGLKHEARPASLINDHPLHAVDKTIALVKAETGLLKVGARDLFGQFAAILGRH